jgi:hypothetical protein
MLSVMRLASVALAIVAVSHRAPAFETPREGGARLEKKHAAAPVVLAVPRLEVKRTLSVTPGWLMPVLRATSVSPPPGRVVTASQWLVVDEGERARLRAHPAHGPPAAS